MKDNQLGYAGTVLMIAAAAIGTVTVVTQQKNQSIRQQIAVADSERERQQIKIAALNTAARYKALLAERKDQASGVYRPGIYAADYFAYNWKTKQNGGLENPEFALDSGSGQVVMASAGSSEKELKRAQNVFNNATSKSQFGESFNLRVVDTNRAESGPGAGLVVESVDVEVTALFAKKSGVADEKIKVRVPLPVPKPYDPAVLYRRKNSGSFQVLTNGAQLSGSEYEFKARASGVFVGMNLLIDNVPHKMGYKDFNNIYHNGRSYDAQNVEMPETISSDFRDSQHVEKNGDSCVVKTVDGSHSVQLELIAVDGETTRTPKITMNTASQKGSLTLEDYANKCVAPDECPYVGGEPYPDGKYDGHALGYYWVDLHGGGKIPDIAGAWNHQEAQGRYQLFNKKLCTRIDHKRISPSDPDWMKKTAFITYTIPSCEARFLMERSTCGCVAEDTLITLGDGKTQKRIDQLVQTDLIWNPIVKKAMRMRNLTRGPEEIPMLEIAVDGKSLSVTGNHPFPTRDGMKTAFKLNDGEEILIDGDRWVKIAKISAVPAAEKAPVVWNIEIDAPNENWDEHHYVANGVVTGDLLIQRQLENAKRSASN